MPVPSHVTLDYYFLVTLHHYDQSPSNGFLLKMYNSTSSYGNATFALMLEVTLIVWTSLTLFLHF